MAALNLQTAEEVSVSFDSLDSDMIRAMRIEMKCVFAVSILLGIVTVFCVCQAPARETPLPSRHVLVVVWDGMGPDFVSQENTPALWKLAHEGGIFRNHHAVYPSATNVNGTALATGVYPGHSGVIANHDYRPEIDNKHSIDVEVPAVVEKGDELFDGKYISVSTMAELVRRAGGRTAIAAAKTVGLLLDRHADRGRGQNCVTLFAGKSLPREAFAPIADALGPFPSAHLQQDAWTTKALTHVLWKDGVPAFSVLWLGEPDLTQHESAPGAPPALAAIKSADDNLVAVVAALDRQKIRATTDIFVVSDHGFSTIEHSVDFRKILNEAGFTAMTQFTSEPKKGDIMLVGNGGTVLFYVIGHDLTVTHRLVEFLQQSDFAGVIFTKESISGTFGFDKAKIDNEHVPDVEMAF